MGQPAIVEKLRRALSEDIRSECQVVYILVEIRKLADLTGTTSKYNALAFYCSWALHVEMSWKEAQKLLRHFEEAHPLFRAGKELHEVSQIKGRDVENITTLRYFKDDLNRFLEENHLPDNVIQAQWAHFMHYYTKVIEDCPLIVKPSAGAQSILDKVIVNHELGNSLIPYDDVEAYQPYRVTWTCFDHSGQSGSIQIYNTFPVPASPAP